METTDAEDKAIASEPGENVKEWTDKEGKDFDDKMKSAKAMAEDTSEGNRSN
jgi:hypothetical protein